MANKSLKETTPRTVRTGTTVKIDIAGVSLFKPPTDDRWRTLALYANLGLPAPNSVAREALARGGWRVWFQQVTTDEPDKRDETGLLGPIPFARYGTQNLLISHSWPHTVDADAWEFCLKAYAFDATGKAVDLPLTLGTREIKFIV